MKKFENHWTKDKMTFVSCHIFLKYLILDNSFVLHKGNSKQRGTYFKGVHFGCMGAAVFPFTEGYLAIKCCCVKKFGSHSSSSRQNTIQELDCHNVMCMAVVHVMCSDVHS